MTLTNDELQQERLRRWRLSLGGEPDGTGCNLTGDDKEMDRALETLYGQKGGFGKGKGQPGGTADGPGTEGAPGGKGDGESSGERRASKEASNPTIARWLGDIRKYFPTSVVQVMQRDAIERYNKRELLFEPEMLDAVVPDPHLVAELLTLKDVMPSKTRDSARVVVQKLVDELTKRLQNPMQQAVRGAINRATRNYRPRFHEINWHMTIRRNLKHYQPDYKSIIPETLIGYGHKRNSLRDVILCIDQSGSMGESVVYSSIFGAVMASLPALKTHMVVYDTEVVDLTEHLTDPVELLFGAQLGGGNDGPRALRYCEQLVTRPRDTIFVLVSDLYESDYDEAEMLRQIGRMQAAGVQFVVLLALSDKGAPSYKHSFAQSLAEMDIPAFACTPDLFPDLMGAAINRQHIGQWAARNDIATK